MALRKIKLTPAALRGMIAAFALLHGMCGRAQYSDSTGHYIGAFATGNFNRASGISSYLYNNSLKFGIRKKKLALNSSNKWLYGRQNDVLTNNDKSALLEVDLHRSSPRFYYWGLFNYNSIYSLKINHQLQSGFGVAYDIIDRDDQRINISDGLIGEYSDLQQNDTLHDIYRTIRNSLRLLVKWSWKNRIVFAGTAFLQNSLQYRDDYIIKSDVSLSIKLRKWLSLTAALSYNRMSRTRTETLNFTYGVSFERYF
jgi:hypothetical protein